MNFTGLTLSSAIIAGTACRSIAAWNQGAEWVTPVFTVLSFYVSLYTGLIFMWLSDMAWHGSLGPDPRESTKTAHPMKMAACKWLYMIMPLFAMCAAAAACPFATGGILRLFT